MGELMDGAMQQAPHPARQVSAAADAAARTVPLDDGLAWVMTYQDTARARR